MNNIQECLAAAARQLQKAGIATARLDALVLLEDVTGRERGWLLARPESEISPAQAAELKNLLSRRARHEPLAYVRGKAEFYGREFVLTLAVLQPRPESETMIELFKALPVFSDKRRQAKPSGTKTGHKLSVADVGAGSGALGITAALEVPEITVDLLDIDPEALKIAKINVDKFTPGLNIRRGDLLAGAKRSYDVLLCNLPYVPDDYQINLAAGHEPPIAIFGGPDGLDLYRKLFDQVAELPKQPLYILTEALPPQHAVLARIAKQTGYKLSRKNDFIQLFERIQKMA